MAQAEVLPIEITGKDNSGQAWDALKSHAMEVRTAIESLRGSLGSLSAGSNPLNQLTSLAKNLKNPYVVAAAAVVGLGIAAVSTHGNLSQLGEDAEILGKKASLIDGLSAALRRAGGDANVAGSALKTLMAGAESNSRDGGSLEDLFKANDKSLTGAGGGLRSLEDIYSDVAGFIVNARNETDRLAIATKAFGSDAAPSMVKAIQDGATALERLTGGVDGLDPAVLQAREFDRIWKEITRSTDGFVAILKNEVTPILSWAYDKALAVAGAAGSKSAVESRYLLNNPNAQRMLDRSSQNAIDRLYNDVGFVRTNMPGNRKDKPDPRNDFDRILTSIGKHISMMEADARAVGKTAGEHERLRTEQQLLDAAQRAGLPMTEARTRQIQALGERARAAADDLAFLKLKSDIMFEREQMGRSDTEQTVAARLRGAQVDAQSAQGMFLADQIRINEQLKLTRDIAGDALKGFIADLRQGRSAAEAFEGMLGRVLDKLLNLSLDTALNSLLGGGGGSLLANLFGGGAGGGSASGMGASLTIPSTLYHSGGIIGAGGGPRRMIHPSYFDNAPRFHRGGILGPDEMPIIGKVGEEVLTEGDPRHSRNGGGGAKVQVHNYAAPGTSTEVKQRRENGVDIIEMIHSTVNDGMANGRYDQTQRARFGASVRSRGR